MWNWSVDEIAYKKQNADSYRLWELVQKINYGLDENEKLDQDEIKKSWPLIKERLDPYKARFFEYLLWGKLYSLPNNLSFWNVSSKNLQ